MRANLSFLAAAALLPGSPAQASILSLQHSVGPAAGSEEVCAAKSQEDARTQIAQLTLWTYASRPAATLRSLRKARCLAQRYDQQSEELVTRLLELQYDSKILSVTEEALVCLRRGALTIYSDEEISKAVSALRECVPRFTETYPNFFELRSELLIELSGLVSLKDKALGKQLEDESFKLLGYDFTTVKISSQPIEKNKLITFLKSKRIFDKWFEARIGSTADESEPKETTEAEARAKFMADLKITRSAIRELQDLDPSSWSWLIFLMEHLSADLFLGGAIGAPESSSLRTENIALWKRAAVDLQRSPYPDSVGIAYLNLAKAQRASEDLEAAVEAGIAAASRLTSFAQRARLAEAVTLTAGAMVELGRPSEAANILFSWLAAYGDEKMLFKNRTGRGRESPRYAELARHQARVHSAIADVLESEERFGEAEPFRRLVFEAARGEQEPGFRHLQINSTFDLALNLAQQRRLDEAAKLGAAPTGTSSDFLGATLEKGSRAERAARLAVLTGDGEGLERWIEEAEESRKAIGLLPSGEVVRHKALLFASRGEFDQAEGLLQELISYAEQNGLSSRFTSWIRAELARVKLLKGDTAAAIVSAREALGIGASGRSLPE